MQSLYAHSIGYLTSSSSSFSHRLGGLYCLYCLYETQPFKRPFKIYISFGELKHLRSLVQDAKEKGVKVACASVEGMMERNLFLYGFVDINQGSITDRVHELTDIQNARIQLAYKKLFPDKRIEHFIHMEMACQLVDVENIKHIAEGRLVGDVVEKTADDWNVQKELFYEQTGYCHPLVEANVCCKRKILDDSPTQNEVAEIVKRGGSKKLDERERDDGFGKELEEVLLSLQFENNEENS